MGFSPGEEVVAVRPLGLIDRVSPGMPGIVRESRFLGEYTVEFFDGPVLRGVKESEIAYAPIGPWWLQDPGNSQPEEPPQKEEFHIGGLVFRFLAASFFVTLLIYAFSLYR